MGYVPVIPPSLRVRPVPPQNQRGDKVGASIPPMIEMFNRGRMEPDDIRKLELSVEITFSTMRTNEKGSPKLLAGRSGQRSLSNTRGLP
jgi:hypothetical protein